MITFNTKTKKTTFQISAPDAKTVRLLGDFNGWNPESHPMKKGKTGNWKIDVSLPPGTYQFRYFIDQSWWMNDQTVGAMPNDQGSENSIVTVEPLKTTHRKTAAKKSALKKTTTVRKTRKK
jgi:1,4-alpha-glucan branching enzyme